jgi:putative hydrolase of the HAD superfamily
MVLKLILLDADDTLWHNMRYFDQAERAFADMLAPLVEAGMARELLARTEARNLASYGYGAKSFTLSLIETAIEIGGDALPISTIRDILAAGRELLSHPVELLANVQETIEALSQLGELVLVTKGDLLHQEMKLAASGLGEHFSAVEIVSEKTPDTFSRLFAARGLAPEQAIMAGDSLRSDVLPALKAGAWAAFVPHDIVWSHEQADEPTAHPRYRRISGLIELPALISDLNGCCDRSSSPDIPTGAGPFLTHHE